MKVSLAAQTLSQSVADAIWFCCKDLNLEEFKDAEPTVEFIKCFDILFDLLNSKDASGKFSKAPIFAYNELYWRKNLRKCSAYIRSLRYEDGKSVFTARRRDAVFTGWLNNIEVIQRMFDDLVKTKKLSFLLVYRLSQDPLENFFGSIRSTLGHNNNPTVVQFQAAYKKMISGALNKTNLGNCIEDSLVLIHSDKHSQEVSESSEEGEGALQDISLFSSDLNEYSENILVYMSGYIQRVLILREKCKECHAYLQDESKTV